MLRPFQYKDAVVTSDWLLLTYKVPPEPAAKRIALWRRLKAMGAVYLQNGVCLLPKTDDHIRRLKMLDNDVAEMGGEAVILETVGVDRAQQEKVITRFNSDRDEQYREFLGRCADFQTEIAKEISIKKFTYAELGLGTTAVTGDMEMAFEGTWAHFCIHHFNQDGLVRERSRLTAWLGA